MVKVYVSLSDKLLFKSGSADVEDKGKDAIKKVAENRK
jgi:chemotaxis protein MotB